MLRFLILAYLACFCGLNAIADDSCVDPTQQNFSGRIEMPNSRTCDGTPIQAKLVNFLKKAKNWAEVTSELDCRILFSPCTPGNLDFPEHGWFGACSVSKLWSAVRYDPQMDPTAALKSLDKDLEARDLCTTTEVNKELGLPSDDRNASTYVAPALDDYQKSNGLRPLTEDEKTTVRTNVAKHLHALTNPCCGDDQLCRNVFEKTVIDFCDPTTDRDHCTGGATAPQSAVGRKKIMNTIVSEARKDPHILSPKPGKIKLGPFALLNASSPTQSFVPQDSDDVVFHELAHACNDVHAQFKIQKLVQEGRPTEAAEIADQIKSVTTSTGISQAVSSYYVDQFQSLGVHSETAACIIQVAKDNEFLRFDKSKKCDGANPNYALHEVWGQAFVALVWPKHSIFNAWNSAGGGCNSSRDSWHPFTGDIMNCLNRQPDLRERFEIASGCKKGNGIPYR